MSGDVLPHHDRVVHQAADRQSEPAQREHVQGLAREVEQDQRSGYRQRQADTDDEQIPKVGEKNQNHDEGQKPADQGLPREALNRGSDVGGLVERDAQRHARGQPGQVREGRPQRVDDPDDVGAWLPHHAHRDPRLPVHLHDLRLVGGTIGYVGNVRDAHGDAVLGRHHDLPNGRRVL